MINSILTTTLALFTSSFSATTSSSDLLPAMVTGASLSVDDVDVTITNLGDGHFESELRAFGTVTANGVSVSTQLALDCVADDGAQLLQCTGGIRLGTIDAPIGLQYLDGEAQYALDLDFVQTHGKVWELWYTDLLIDGVPPVDDNGNKATGSFVWFFVDGVVARVVWIESDWLYIMDGVVMNPPNG